MILYHYCDVLSFLEILRSKRIWLSNLACMRDYAEHNWLRHLAISSVRQLRRMSPHPAYDALDWLLENDRIHDPHAACFSQIQDSLSQWRSYADDGRGFALGFDSEHFNLPESFSVRAWKQTDCLALRRVNYDLDYQNRFVAQVVKEFFDDVKDRKDPDKMLRETGHHSSKLWIESIVCKNPKFEEEQEVRIIHTPAVMYLDEPPKTLTHGSVSEIDFHATRGKLVSHFELPWMSTDGSHALAEVILGPANPNPPERIGLVLARYGISQKNLMLARSLATYA